MKFSLLILSILFITVNVLGQVTGGDMLNEAPIYEIPEGMTFEEYRDANRRISVGLMLMSVPVPGMLHFYADEDTKGWICVGAAGLGLASMATGALLRGDKEWPESDYEIIELDGNRYEKIPVYMTGEEPEYQLRRIQQEEEISGGGIILLAFGGALIAGEIIYDWLDGISTIEYKRDKARYKYGSGDRDVHLQPSFGPDGTIGVALKIE